MVVLRAWFPAQNNTRAAVIDWDDKILLQSQPVGDVEGAATCTNTHTHTT